MKNYSRTDTTPVPVVPVLVVVVIIEEIAVPARPVLTGANAMRAGVMGDMA